MSAPSAAPLRRTREPGPFPVIVVRPATTPLQLSPVQRVRRRDAAAWAAGITWRAQDSGTRTTVAYRPRTASPSTNSWARDVIRDAVPLAESAHPARVQIGRTRAAGIVAVVVHADTWSLVIRTRHRSGALDAVYSLAFHDAHTFIQPRRAAPLSRRPVAWNFDTDTTAAGAAWQHMLRAVLDAIT
jgi:hypothetical protein